MSIVRQLPAILAGVLAGLGGAWWFGRQPAAAMTAAASSPTPPAVTSTIVVERVIAPPAASTAGQPAATEKPTRVAAVATSSPDEAARDLEQRFASDFAQHARDGRDSVWSAKAEGSLGSKLRSIAGQREVRGVDCRMTSCVARLSWTNQAAARADYRNLLVASYEPNCATRILLPDAADPSASYEARLFFDCTEARASSRQ